MFLTLPMFLLMTMGWFGPPSPSPRAAVSALAQETPSDPATVAVERGPFRVVLDLEGTFDEPDAAEVTCRPEAYQGALEVIESAPPGPVSKGQVLVKFDTEDLDHQLEKAELDLEMARAGLDRLRQQTSLQEKGIALERRNSEMAYEQARQTFETFRDILMPTRLEEAELSIQSSRDRLLDEEAQFEQLLKMYKADDLVEETEEIVLARSRRGLEQQRKRMVFTERRHELQTQIEIPRELEGYEIAMLRAANEWELARTTSDLKLAQAQGELRKSELAFQRQDADLERLRRDRTALTVRAPGAGLAVAGQLTKGKWTGLSSGATGPREGTKVGAGQVLYTVVQAAPTVVRTRVPEASLLDVQVGQIAALTPAALPRARLAAKVQRVARVSADQQYDVWLEVDAPHSALLPGHACKVALTVLELAQALTVPESAVRKDGDRNLVWVFKDAPVETPVEIGHSSGGRVQILSGLSASDRVLEQAPKDR